MKRKPTDLIFKVEHQFTLYLQRCEITRNQLTVDQLREMRRAFYGGCGQTFFLMTQDVLELRTNKELEQVFNEFVRQITEFWTKQQELNDKGLEEIHPTMVASCVDCYWTGQIQDLTKPQEGSGLVTCPKCKSSNIYYP